MDMTTMASILFNIGIIVNETLGTDIGLVQDNGLVSEETSQVFQVVNYCFLAGPISLCGTGGNIINIVVFCKQGFNDRMNISLFSLAVADLVTLVTMLWATICYNPLFINADLPFHPLDMVFITGAYPHVCFNRISSYITAFISLERCLCITMPIKVKSIITSTRTKLILASIFIILILVYVPFYFVIKLEWMFDGELNKTRLHLVFEDQKEEVDMIVYLVQSVGLFTVPLVTVVICTIILTVKLNKKSKWRHTVISGNAAPSAEVKVSAKDMKIVKIVTFISIIFIICYIPATIIMITMGVEPRFSFYGRFENLYLTAWSFAALLQTVNSSVNILVYYSMSTKYRVTFTTIFCTGGKGSFSAKVRLTSDT